MPRRCTVCDSDEREVIDRALVSGVSQRSVAREHGLSTAAVSRHTGAHVSPALAAVQARREERGAETLMDRIESLYDRASRILEAAEQDGKAGVSLAAIRELRGITELLGRASGELRDQPQVVVNVLTSSEWRTVREALLAALTPHPQARMAVADRLLELEAGE